MPVEIAILALPAGCPVRQMSLLPKTALPHGPQPLNAFFLQMMQLLENTAIWPAAVDVLPLRLRGSACQRALRAACGHDAMIIDAALQDKLRASFANEARSGAKRPVHWTQLLGTSRLFSLGIGLKKAYTLARARGFVPGSRARPLSLQNPFGRSFSSLNPVLSWTSAGTSPMASTF